MRDNHEGLPEIVDAVERDGHYFGVAQVSFGGARHAFEFGVDAEGFRTLRKVLQFRPLGSTEPGSCRYFFAPSVGLVAPESELASFDVRVEQGREGRQFAFTGPRSLVAILVWFLELKSPAGASHLRGVAPRPEA